MPDTPSRDLEGYLKADRQWPRALRIMHAQRMLREDPEYQAFWKAVLRRNGVKKP
jgi:hypothetical protein